MLCFFFFFFKQKTAYEMRISDWSSDVCSSDLQGRGWERFTAAIIRLVNARETLVAFLLWGSYAQKKAAFVESVDRDGRHLVPKAPHPSPLSAHNGFFRCGHFSPTNAFLEATGPRPPDVALPTPVARYTRHGAPPK